MQDNKFTYTRGICALRDHLPIKTRERVMVIIQNINTELLLAIQYKSNNELSFVSGGVEEGEDLLTTLEKEIFEETGIVSYKNIVYMPERYYEVKYFTPYRQENHHNKTHLYFVQTDQEELNPSDVDQKIQTPFWTTIKDMKKLMYESWDTTNYESLEYIIHKLEKHLE